MILSLFWSIRTGLLHNFNSYVRSRGWNQNIFFAILTQEELKNKGPIVYYSMHFCTEKKRETVYIKTYINVHKTDLIVTFRHFDFRAASKCMRSKRKPLFVCPRGKDKINEIPRVIYIYYGKYFLLVSRRKNDNSMSTFEKGDPRGS